MGELKAKGVDDVYLEYFNTGKHDLAQVYLKFEADKAIAEKDEEIYNIKYSRDEWAKACNQKDKEIAELNARIADGDKDFEMANNQNERLLKIVRHQKYKRCLDKVKWCFTKSNYHFVLARHGEDAKENNRRSILYSKWRKRWLKIAKKFQEAK